ncbi:Os03g0379200 [Oryza sativa Japonica Group]|uniref:Os03g0379200 protein n=1 Tax=Oryza sativa subsp. japonica TaxID=39947 RepID=A0A0P0VYR2_ORYSJ|nr:hypothetical protein EE612_017717 [Oryza sativa]BAS84434.1 Os03g0379200 [Oryza sativa Japonica Group]
MVYILVCTLRKLCSTTRKPEHFTLVVNPILDSLLNREALVRDICIMNIITALWPMKRSSITLWCWNQTIELILFRWAMPLPIYHIIPREGHCTLLLLTGSVICVLCITWLESFNLSTPSIIRKV